MEFDASTTRLTDKEIEFQAEDFRRKLGLSPSEVFNIVEVLHSEVHKVIDGFVVETASKEVMQMVEAFTAYEPPRITVRQDVHDFAREGNPRYRLTLAHELGHLVLHSGGVFPRVEMSDQRVRSIPAKESTEAQAYRFGACFLMPRILASRYKRPEGLARVCKVSVKAAQFRLNDLARQEQRENVMRGFEELIAFLKSEE
jgi:IrrE N-terminal-like domain